MVFEVKMPKLGESILSATIVQWFKNVGDFVTQDEPLLEVSTDKVNSEIPSPVSGTIMQICRMVEDECEVGEIICRIDQAQESSIKKEIYSPAVLRAAKEQNLSLEDLQKIPATGSGGRLTLQDVRGVCQNKVRVDDIERIPMVGARKAIADNMVRSFYQAPHASIITEVDVTQIMEQIRLEKEQFLQKNGFKLSITAYLALAFAKAVKKFPLINASIEGDTLLVKRNVNLGIAVSVEGAVLVPVIVNCDQLDLVSVARAISEFAQKAREGTMHPDAFQNGTLTLTNFGISGISIGIPIIRHPEVAILAIGAVKKEPAVLDDGSIAARERLYATLTFDHRAFDGIYACEFMKHFIECIKMQENH